MVRALLLDLMGTVVYDPYREAIEAATGLPLDEVLPLRNPDAWPSFEIGAIDEATFAERFWADPDDGRTFDLEAFTRTRLAHYRYLPGMRELIEDLQGVLDCHIASNYPVWVEDLVDRMGLRPLTQGVWSSHHLGVRKPDPAFFERLGERIGLPARECLFVDDREVNCTAAQEAGMRAHLFREADGLRATLAALGIETG